ncbi:DUF262 domain-containing HNH endonuclease family protein [Marinifilum fragile]|uniref:DUF262 domain-containing protein n=1 Tax=Marinifilum fragile TaxID=570161 RepID=UPI002AA8B7BB|nr:DUF262 domain-containing HNH endonuclease family protein [Marinifilum fragile]
MDNYNLDTGKRYIKDVFAPECFYNIPEYQRPYVWGNDQVTALLDDLTAAIEHDDNKEYFLGCMIWNTKTVQSNGLKYTYQDILDGQQRFITLFLLHGVIRDLSDDNRLKKKVVNRLRQEEDVYDGVPERNRIVFEIRDDKDFLDKYLLKEGGTDNEDELSKLANTKTNSTSVRNMALSILSIRKWWKNLSKTKGDNDEYQEFVQQFFQYLSSKVLVLYLATPNNLDDAYNLFTVLNSRGLQLQVSDILRAQNLRIISDDKERKKYAEKWTSFEDNIGEPFSSFDDFLWSLVFINMKYRSDDNQSLPKAFEFMWKRNMLKKGVSTFEFVEKYVGHYEAITNGSITSKETGCLFSNLNMILTSVFGNQYMTPLMYYRECFGEYRIIDFIIKLDNLLSIPWLTGKRTSQTRVFIILRKMNEFKGSNYDTASIETAADNFLESEYLKYDYQDEKASTELDINELFAILDKENWGSYAGTRINKTRYLLLKLDLLLGNFNTSIQFNKNNSSVEHLIPRKIQDTSWDIDSQEHMEWLHRLGNLVLIDRRKNASLSNRLFDEKKIRYQGAIETRANTNFVFMNNSVWNIFAVKQNHYRVLEILKDYYLGNSVKAVIAIKDKVSKYDNSKIVMPFN